MKEESASTMTDVRWGMIGCGDVTEKKSAPALRLVDHSDLVAVTNRTIAKAHDYARRHQVDYVFATAEELVADPRVNAIYIATPPGSHLELARLVAAANKPLYVEKPMARSFAECQEMNSLFENAGLPLAVAYYRRALPNFLKVQSLLEEERIGPVQSVDITLYMSAPKGSTAQPENNWRVDPSIAGGGLFYDLGSHQFDLLEFLFGPIHALHGYKSNLGSPYAAADTVSASWTFDNGILGSGRWNFNAPKSAACEQIRILGTRGEIAFPCFANGLVTVVVDGKKEELVFDLPYHIQQPLIENVVRAFRGLEPLTSSGASAARANYWLESVQEAF
ncbi:MAG: Gfo/Idh/MocA family oxidoreductase [Saprospiraceae bacterium]|nr:Gfo/Idh/MocA family oxidoreductase [Saprospiraceae bacterium]